MKKIKKNNVMSRGNETDLYNLFGRKFPFTLSDVNLNPRKRPRIIRSVPSLAHLSESNKGNGSFVIMPFNDLSVQRNLKPLSVEGFGEVGVLGWLATQDNNSVNAILSKIRLVEEYYYNVMKTEQGSENKASLIVSHWTGSYKPVDHSMYEIIYSPLFKESWTFNNDFLKKLNGTGKIYESISKSIGDFISIDIAQPGYYAGDSFNCTDVVLRTQQDQNLCDLINHPTDIGSSIIHNSGLALHIQKRENLNTIDTAGFGFIFTKRNIFSLLAEAIVVAGIIKGRYKYFLEQKKGWSDAFDIIYTDHASVRLSADDNSTQDQYKLHSDWGASFVPDLILRLALDIIQSTNEGERSQILSPEVSTYVVDPVTKTFFVTEPEYLYNRKIMSKDGLPSVVNWLDALRSSIENNELTPYFAPSIITPTKGMDSKMLTANGFDVLEFTYKSDFDGKDCIGSLSFFSLGDYLISQNIKHPPSALRMMSEDEVYDLVMDVAQDMEAFKKISLPTVESDKDDVDLFNQHINDFKSKAKLFAKDRMSFWAEYVKSIWERKFLGRVDLEDSDANNLFSHGDGFCDPYSTEDSELFKSMGSWISIDKTKEKMDFQSDMAWMVLDLFLTFALPYSGKIIKKAKKLAPSFKNILKNNVITKDGIKALEKEAFSQVFKTMGSVGTKLSTKVLKMLIKGTRGSKAALMETAGLKMLVENSPKALKPYANEITNTAIVKAFQNSDKLSKLSAFDKIQFLDLLNPSTKQIVPVLNKSSKLQLVPIKLQNTLELSVSRKSTKKKIIRGIAISAGLSVLHGFFDKPIDEFITPILAPEAIDEYLDKHLTDDVFKMSMNMPPFLSVGPCLDYGEQTVDLGVQPNQILSEIASNNSEVSNQSSDEDGLSIISDWNILFATRGDLDCIIVLNPNKNK